ncbi:MAG: PEP-CTERM/exosortase system-associated acyltransferase [Cellvibrionaceae bacterium]|nr:PEP-CTERM/exosortase system-associated acyltransferase [Cellvibrionaceae bacterium]MCV6626104.1 PEP-CTERM/exosortase system-associated acyltransferase [Cellvibrionaceae bacterium]
MTLLEHFIKFYDVRRAFTGADLEACYRIRYQVFCRELNYFDAESYNKEVDDYDAFSEHALLIHRLSHRPIACTRIVGVDPSQPERPLPYEEVFKDHLDRANFDPDVFLPGQVTELSRLAVLPDFRSDHKRNKQLPENADLLQSCHTPIVPLALFCITVALFLCSEADYGMAMMEPKLAGLIRQAGISCEEIGEPVSHKGWRLPFLFERDKVLRKLNRETADLYRELEQRLQASRVEMLQAQQNLYA